MDSKGAAGAIRGRRTRAARRAGRTRKACFGHGLRQEA